MPLADCFVPPTKVLVGIISQSSFLHRFEIESSLQEVLLFFRFYLSDCSQLNVPYDFRMTFGATDLILTDMFDSLEQVWLFDLCFSEAYDTVFLGFNGGMVTGNTHNLLNQVSIPPSPNITLSLLISLLRTVESSFCQEARRVVSSGLFSRIS